MHMRLAVCLVALAVSCASGWSFEVDSSAQPAAHPPLSPGDGATANTNPPSMIWRVDDRATSYALEMCQQEGFKREVIRVWGINMPLYNHSQELAQGRWYWRYLVVTEAGKVSERSPARSFVITADSVPLPVPPTEQILRNMPDHPRIFVTPDTLEQFRARREGPAWEAWEDI
jgi:hypothetical protein